MHNHHTMKIYREEGMEIKYHVLLHLALHGNEWSVSRFGRFTTGKRAPGNHWI